MDGFQLRKERKKESIQSAALALFKKYGIKKRLFGIIGCFIDL